MVTTPPTAAPLAPRRADLSQCSVSGLSSGAFMTVQLHLAHSSMFVGAGIIAGGPYRCVESFPAASAIAEDAYVQNALFICMNPLTAQVGPQPDRLIRIARQTAADGLIDALQHLKGQRLYIFTGSQDQVVSPLVVQTTRAFYVGLGVDPDALRFVDEVPAGHAILSDHLEYNALEANAPPYINRWTHMQSHDILRHLHPGLKPASSRATGQLMRFDQWEFVTPRPASPEGRERLRRSCMSRFGYVYVPQRVLDGAPCRVHVALHGCKQGYNYVDLTNGRPDRANDPPYGNRYMTTTGYNEMADANDLVILYPQVEGIDDGLTQNPEGCWDWWGYSSDTPTRPDYYSKNAVQIQAIHGMLQRLGGA